MSCNLIYLKELMKRCVRKGYKYADEIMENGNEWLLEQLTKDETYDIEELIDECKTIEELLIVWSFHMYQRGYYLCKNDKEDVTYIW